MWREPFLPTLLSALLLEGKYMCNVHCTLYSVQYRDTGFDVLYLLKFTMQCTQRTSVHNATDQSLVEFQHKLIRDLDR